MKTQSIEAISELLEELGPLFGGQSLFGSKKANL